MKKKILFWGAIFCCLLYSFRTTDFPKAYISNGLIRAAFLLPNSTVGYYQATRFDWSGVIESLDYKGHSYFGKWFKAYDAKSNDAITGPVEEFEPIGYGNAQVGEKFIKIGVGVLLKKDEKPYSPFLLYDISNPGKWEVITHKDWIEFTQTLKDSLGYGYVYKKKLSLLKGLPTLLIEHSLLNTGKLPIETNVYDHNFFMIDKQPSGPEIKIKFPFDIQGTGVGIGSLASIEGKEIVYLRELNETQHVHLPSILGFSNNSKEYDFRIENSKTGAGVRIMGDKPLERMVFWSSTTTYCPEPYIHIKVAAGNKYKWKITYNFYEVPAEKRNL